MGKYLLVLPVIFLLGCASLQEVAEELPNINPTKEIGAVKIIVDDFVEKPYENAIALGIGYALALLRRMYKKKKGSKG